MRVKIKTKRVKEREKKAGRVKGRERFEAIAGRLIRFQNWQTEMGHLTWPRQFWKFHLAQRCKALLNSA